MQKLRMLQRSLSAHVCISCKAFKGARDGHVKAGKGGCVRNLDHKCQWLASYIGQGNHGIFLWTLSLMLTLNLSGVASIQTNVLSSDGNASHSCEFLFPWWS